MFTRELIEATKHYERPSLRCKFECTVVDEDGRKQQQIRETTGHITIDGNNPWICFYAAGKQYAECFPWELILQALNDKFAAPIYLSEKGIVYEV